MHSVRRWFRQRWCTTGLAVYFLLWYAGQMLVLLAFGFETALWLFYFEQPLTVLSPGVVLAPVSHQFYNLSHVGFNVLILLLAGGLVEPRIGPKRVLMLVLGFGYLSIYLTNITALIHGFWAQAGTSGGVLALWVYAGLVSKDWMPGILSNDAPLETWMKSIGVAVLIISIPLFLIQEAVLKDPPNIAHVLGMVLGFVFSVFD